MILKDERQNAGASVPDQALAVPVEPVSRLDPSGFDPSRELLGKVLDYYEGRKPYDFHRLPDLQRSFDAFDAWQEIASEIAKLLGREHKTKRQRRRERKAAQSGSVHEGADPKDIAQ